MERLLQWKYLGLVPYDTGRQQQQGLLEQRLDGCCEDAIIVCQHPPTITFGKNFNPAESDFSNSFWEILAPDYRKVARGGQATFHSPGQLLIYPVFHLTTLRLGVRSFVNGSLSVISDCLERFGIENKVSDEPVGIWVCKGTDEKLSSKIVFAGVRVCRGVTDHGFAINFDNDLTPFSYFNSCGLKSPVTSVKQELGSGVSIDEFLKLLEIKFREWHLSC